MGPLHGLKVIEMAGIGPVPMCATLLADLGADVVRVDRTTPSGLGVQFPRRHEVHGRSRRSLALDLKLPAARAVLLRLVAGADVLLEGLRPGVTEKLGLGPEDCRARNPRLIYGRMTGFGQSGPLAGAAGHDINYIALSGALHALGAQGGRPLAPLNLVGDYGGGALYLALGVLAALFERQRSGQGQVVDAAMVDGAASLAGFFYGLHAAGLWGEPRGENLLDGGAPFYDTYETADGRYVALAPLEPKFFAEFVRLTGLDARFVPRQYERAQWPALRTAIAALMKTRTRQEWCALLEGSDACFAPVLDFDEAPHHPHAQARAGFVEVEGNLQPAPAPRFGRSTSAPPRPAPQLGEHTRSILAEAGLADAEIDALLAAKAARQAPEVA